MKYTVSKNSFHYASDETESVSDLTILTPKSLEFKIQLIKDKIKKCINIRIATTNFSQLANLAHILKICCNEEFSIEKSYEYMLHDPKIIFKKGFLKIIDHTRSHTFGYSICNTFEIEVKIEKINHPANFIFQLYKPEKPSLIPLPDETIHWDFFISNELISDLDILLETIKDYSLLFEKYSSEYFGKEFPICPNAQSIADMTTMFL